MPITASLSTTGAPESPCPTQKAEKACCVPSTSPTVSPHVRPVDRPCLHTASANDGGAPTRVMVVSPIVVTGSVSPASNSMTAVS